MSYDILFRQSLKKTIDKISVISNQDLESFCNIWTCCSFPKKTIITEKGQQEEHLYYILEGVQRVYYYDEQDREATVVFTYNNTFGGVIDSFLNRSISNYYYETLSDSIIFKTSFSSFNILIRENPEIAFLTHKMLSFTIAGLLERLVEMQCYSAEEKFRKMFARSPHMLQLVPQKYLANYLGIDYSNFSKFINKIKI